MNMKPHEKISFERWSVAAIIVILFVLIAAVSGTAFGVPFPLGMALALVLGLASWKRVASGLPRKWDGPRGTPRSWQALLLVLGLVAVVRTTGVAWFMADATHTQGAVYWFDQFATRHSCLTGYWRGAELARAGAGNLYDVAHYTGSIGRFWVDEFIYVPQFLILPRLGLALGDDFYKMRALWFAFQAAVTVCALLAICLWIGGAAGRRAAWLLPALWASTPVLETLQISNYQVAAIALAVFAMVCFERGRHALGGVLLAAAGFKLFPLLLCVYLISAKRWRPVVWTIGFTSLFCLGTYVWMGGQPFVTFLHYDWPRLISGEAWSFVEEDPRISAINDSVSGLILKLKVLGVAGMSHKLEAIVGWIWTALAVILAVLAGRRSFRLTRLQRACCWLSLLTLASFRVRFVPDVYGLIAPLWLCTLIIASPQLTWRNRVWLGVAWIALDAVMPFHGVPITGTYRMIASTVSQFIAIGLCLRVLLGYILRSQKIEGSVASASLTAAQVQIANA